MKISTIVGSVRRNRFAHKPAFWIHGQLQKRTGIESTVLDLLDYPMPHYDEPVSPSRKTEPYNNPVVEAWTDAIQASDAFIIVTPEYNHSFPAVLKNSLDYVYNEWNDKPVAYIGYGAMGGVRAIQQLRIVTSELKMIQVHYALHLPRELLIAHRQNENLSEKLASLDASAARLIDELTALYEKLH